MKLVKVFTCLGVVVIVIVSCWMLLPQSKATMPLGEVVWNGPETLLELEGLTWKDACKQLAPEWEQASVYKVNGNWDAAGDHYIRIASWLPKSHQTMSALLLAARFRVEAGRTEAAKTLYDAVVSVGRDLIHTPYDKPRVREQIRQLGTGRRRISEMMFQALWKKCELEHATGQMQDALATAAQLRTEFPEYHYVRKVLPIEAAITGISVEQLRADEKTASAQCDQLRPTWKAGNREEALALADSILVDYPKTAAALHARHIKTRMLWQLKRYEEACQVSRDLLDSCASDVSNSKFVRDARWRVAWLDSERLMKDLIRRSRTKDAIAPEEWQQVRDLCRYVMANAPNPLHRATMNVLLLESLCWQWEYAKAVEATNTFFRNHYGPNHMEQPEYRKKLLWGRAFAAWSLAALDRNEEAIEHYQAIIQAYEDDPNAWSPATLLPDAHYGLWKVLRQLGAPPEEVAAAGSPLLENLPRSPYARRIYWADR